MTRSMTLLALLLAAAALPAGAQSPPAADLRGTISARAAARIALAVLPTAAGRGAELADAAEVSQVLRDDLQFSGWFGLLDPAGEGRVPADQLGEPKAWKAAGAAHLVTTSLRVEEGSRALFNLRLSETGGGQLLIDRTWGGTLPRDLRRLAHVAADEVVSFLTGRAGIAQTRLAFVSGRGAAKEVYLMDYDGARLRRLTNTGTISLTPAWSPDGRRMTFLSYRGRKPSIYLLDEDGKITTLAPRGGELNAAPDFSPDGHTLCFSSDRDGNSELYLYDLDNGQETRLTNNPAIDTAPAWSPSGREIAFTSDRSGTPQIYVMAADGSNVRRVTMDGKYNESAAWSPDGGRLAFVSRIDGQFEILVHDLGTGRETVVTTGRGNKENPRWSPDGRHLVFAGDTSGSYAIYTVRDDGSDLRRLTKGDPSFTPDWSPVRR